MKIILVVCIVASYLLQTVQIEREQEILIPGVSASKVMAYVGDWNNHKNLNPHILDWSIEDIENVSSDQTILRSYRLSYTELYEHIPWLMNTAEGLVTVIHKGDNDLQMISSHSTCLLPLGLWCLNSQALNTFSQQGENTRMTEAVKVECPWLLSPLCSWELQTQRSKVLRNIQYTKF